jgi:hypothetical protein
MPDNFHFTVIPLCLGYQRFWCVLDPYHAVSTHSLVSTYLPCKQQPASRPDEHDVFAG